MRKLTVYNLLILTSIPVALILFVCIRAVDTRIALMFWNYTSSRPCIHHHIIDLHNTLPSLLIVATIVTTAAWLIYRTALHTSGQGQLKEFVRLAAITIPVSFLLKTYLQFVFGHTSTRAWLQIDAPLRFHWFNDAQSGSFPSGHSMVLSAALTAGCLFYPRMLTLAAVAMLALASALLFTSYHFVSDIIAGVYCGILISVSIRKALSTDRAEFD